ncbi:hypothetical protein [Steroidobacter sp.]|uniref:hypothetical protein n=1 Tax=Steroidobacter sp. TaxID=1978227 RepID=UPI001A451867|nr:hypothetical protein [Steroidobacter sp.]MBL8269348.1 hypothetical protein [Steroidobacter sp.]
MKYFPVIILAALSAATPLTASAQKHKPATAGMYQQSGQLPPQQVQRYVIDVFGDVDGLLLADGSLVKFPAHQSSEVRAAIAPGDSVAVTGAITQPKVIEAWQLSNTNSGAVLIRTPKPKFAAKLPKHLRSATLRQLEAQGRVSHLVYGKKGEVKMALLEDGTALRLGKQAQWVIGSQLSVGRMIAARGVGTQNEFGRSLEATEIGVDNGPMTSLYGVTR